jgi:hypothetical protein
LESSVGIATGEARTLDQGQQARERRPQLV